MSMKEGTVKYFSVPDQQFNKVKSELNIIKKTIEGKGNCSLELDEKDRRVILKCESTGIYEFMRISKVIEAIIIGFSYVSALRLMDESKDLVIINLKDYASNPQHERRIKARIIGESGKVKRNIQELTSTEIIIADHVVSIIGKAEDVELAKRAIQMLIEGKEHSTVYKFLNRAVLSKDYISQSKKDV